MVQRPMIAAEFGELLGESEASERFGLMAERASASFEGGFWHERGWGTTATS